MFSNNVEPQTSGKKEQIKLKAHTKEEIIKIRTKNECDWNWEKNIKNKWIKDLVLGTIK